jgi:hypothetical protein
MEEKEKSGSLIQPCPSTETRELELANSGSLPQYVMI